STSIDGNERWRTRVPGGADVQEHLSKFLGEGTDFEVISTWSMRGSRAMANSYRSGRVFLAGDSAHMHTPYGGKAANTGMQDGIDLAWKLGAVLQGWGGPHLLDSYQVERRPIALQLHRFQGLDLSGAEPRPIPGGGPEVPGLNLDFHGDSAEAKRARIETADRLREARKDEFDHPGLELGFRYEGSPIIWPDESPAPPEEITSYTQTSRPGARAPHGWLKAGVSTLDTLGDGFTLMRFGPSTLDTSSFESAAVRRGVPLTLADFDQPHLRELYGGVRMALVRPDGMVAWRGDVLPRPDELLDRVCGFEVPSAARTSKQATSAGMRA
ncbi:MAG: FAD-dependent monooxygenase, partial [Dehalococcoidia bacterium]|nr:FAD-dependent monooxygenase [Dehalococcoidia bacterium]